MINILFLKNKLDTPSRYNYEINYKWVDVGANMGLYDAYEWFIDHIPIQDELNAYIAKYDIDCIISLCAKSRFEAFNVSAWYKTLENVEIPKLLRAGDTCYESFDDDFFGLWDHIWYRMADKNGSYPERGMFLPWGIDPETYKPEYGGDTIKMIGTAGEAYPLRNELRILNRRYYLANGRHLFADMTNQAQSLHGESYRRELRSARAVITTGNKVSPEMRAKALEAAACGALIITPPCAKLDHYFTNDYVSIFRDAGEFIDTCNDIVNMKMDVVIKKQTALSEYVRANHNCEKLLKEYIMPAIRGLN